MPGKKVLGKLKNSIFLFLLLCMPSSAYADGIIINAGATLRATGSPTITTNGNWDNNGTFVAASSTVVLNGTTSTTLEAGGSSFNNLTINKTSAAAANDNVTVQTDALSVTGTTTLTDGELVQTTTNITLNGITVAAAGSYTNDSTGDLTLSGAVANAGTIAFNGNGGGSGDADDILIRSSVLNTQRNWQGAGTFTMTDVDVRDQTAVGGTPPFIFVTSGTNTGNNINWFFGNGTLAAVDVEPASLVAGAEGDVTVTFTLQNGFPNDGRLVIDFGSGFDATGLAAITNVSNIDGGWAVAVSNGDGTGDVVTLTRDGAGTQTAAGTTVSIRLEDEVRNPLVPGSTGVYTVTTQLSDSTTIDTGTAAADTIVAGGALNNVSITPASLIAGAVVNNTVVFTTTTALPADGQIQITYPEGFDVSGVTSATSTADLDGTLTVSVSGQVVTITRAGGTPLGGGSTVDDLVIGPVRNPTAVGLTGTFTVYTRNAADVLLDAGTAAGVTITANEQLILLTLDASPRRVRIGQIVNVTATLENKTDESGGGTSISLAGFNLISNIPGGLVFRPGSADSDSGEFVEGGPGSQVTFSNIDNLPANGQLIFTYQAVVGSNAETGNLSISAFAQINPIISNTASVSLEIVPDPIFEVGTLIGKVFWDKNEDGRQQKGEPGIPNARVATEEGVLITTDTYGRYHVPDVTPGRHMVKVDMRALPTGAKLTTTKSKLIHSTDAMLNKVNFGIQLDLDMAAELKIGERKEPIAIRVRRSSSPPVPRMDIDFSLTSAPEVLSIPGTPDKSWILPFNPMTNFPGFIKKWSLDLYELKGSEKKGSFGLFDLDQERVKIASKEGVGKPPREVPFIVEAKTFLESSKPLQLEFAVFDHKGRLNIISYQLVAKETSDSVELALSDYKKVIQEIRVKGTGVILDLESSLKNRIEIFGVPVPLDSQGLSSAEWILPEGKQEILLDVYVNGYDPVKKKVLEAEPTRIVRYFNSSDNEFFHVGFGDLEIGHLSARGNRASLSANDQNRLEKYLYSDHRFAYYVKAKWGGKYYLTASIDTERTRKELFRNLEPEDFYATYGDNSKIEYDAANTQDEVYFMLEADKSYFRYGNFGTGFTGTEFADFSRTFHGFKAHYESVKTGFDQNPKTLVTAFAAKARQLATHNEFRGTGGSLYYLKHREVIQGSEKVRKEVRDKVTGIVISETQLTFGQDYDVDYDSGRIRLYRPLTSVTYDTDSILSTDLLEGNPQYLVVDYEYDAGDINSEKAKGLRVSTQWIPGLRLGGTLVEESRFLEDYHLMGIDGSFQFRELLKVRGEIAKSDVESTSQFISDDGGLSFTQATTAGPGTDGLGYKIEAELNPWKGMQVEGYVRRLDRDFSSTGTLSQAGTRKYGVLATQLFGKWGKLTFQHHDEVLLDDGNEASDNTGAEHVKLTQIEAEVKKGKVTAKVAYRHTDTDEERTVQEENFAVPKEDEEQIAADVQIDVTEKTKVRMNAQMNLTGESNAQLRTGVIHKVNDQTALFATHVVGSRGNGVIAGVDTAVYGKKMKLTKAFGTEKEGAAEGGEDLASSLRDLVQKTTLGWKKKVGKNAEFKAAQDVSGQGLGKRVLSLEKSTDKDSFSVIHESEQDKDSVIFSQEKQLHENVTVYSNTSLNRDKAVEVSDVGHVRGIKADFLEDRLAVYREEEQAFHQGGQRSGSRTGADLQLTPELSMGFSYEKGQTQTSQVDTAHQAAQGTLQYVKPGKAKFYADFEYRHDDAQTDYLQFLSTGKGELKLNPDWTLLGRWEWSKSRDITDSDNETTANAFSEYQVGLAYRPTEVDWLNLFAEYKKLSEKGTQQQDVNNLGSETSHILRGEAAIDIHRYVTLVEKVALRRSFTQVRTNGGAEIDSQTMLWANRLNFHLTDYLDMIVEYRMLRQSLALDTRHGILSELNLKVLDGVRFGVGYNSLRYDSSLAGSLDVETSGFYFRLVYEPIETAESYAGEGISKVFANLNRRFRSFVGG